MKRQNKGNPERTKREKFAFAKGSQKRGKIHRSVFIPQSNEAKMNGDSRQSCKSTEYIQYQKEFEPYCFMKDQKTLQHTQIKAISTLLKYPQQRHPQI
jgi:hypothetical protein